MSTKTNAMLTLNYEDNSTRNVTFKDIDVNEMQYMADRVILFEFIHDIIPP